MAAVLLDTHIALWLGNRDERLRAPTRAMIDECWKGGGIVIVSAVTIWEIAQLVSTGRIGLDRPVDAWVEMIDGHPGVEVVALNHQAASLACRLPGLAHKDPVDRLLIATAIGLQCPLITYDERILTFASRYGAPQGFTVGG